MAKIKFTDAMTCTYIEVFGKRSVIGSYPLDYKDKKGYLVNLLKRAT